MYPEDQLPIDYLKGYLNNPSRVKRQLTDATKGKTIADYAFGTGDAKQGAVIYDRVLGRFVETTRDVEKIADGAKFPLIGLTDQSALMAKVDTYGGAAEMTWKAINRNETDTWNRRQKALAGLVIEKVNKLAVAAIVADEDVNEHIIETPWTTVSGTDPIADIFMGKTLIDDVAELGYKADTALINPLDAQLILGRKDIREQYPRESRELNPVLSADLAGIGSLNWIKSNAVPLGSAYILQSKMIGSVRDEEGGLQTNVFDDQERHVKIVQAWRSIVPIITDPKAITVLRGIR